MDTFPCSEANGSSLDGSTGINGQRTIVDSWYGMTNVCLRNPLEIVAYAKIDETVGVPLNSSTYIIPSSSPWATDGTRLSSVPVCVALGTDNTPLVLRRYHRPQLSHRSPAAMMKSGLYILLFCALFVHTQWLNAQPSQIERDSNADYQALTFGLGSGAFIDPIDLIARFRLAAHVGYSTKLFASDFRMRALFGANYTPVTPQSGHEIYQFDITGHYSILRGNPGLTVFAGMSIFGFGDGQYFEPVDPIREAYSANTRTLKRKLNAVVGFGVPFERFVIECSLHVSMFATRPHYFADDYSYEHKFFELKVLYDFPL